MPILDRFSLAGRTALVTGAGRGIGRAYAEALAEAGASVACADIDKATAEETASALESRGVHAMALGVDVTDIEQVQTAVRTIVDAWGKLDIGVNNAGISRGGPAETLSEANWDAVLDVNLKAVFLCCQAEAQVMLSRSSGVIINTASMSGQIVNRPQLHVNYNAAKAGVVQLTRNCAAEWASRGVRVNSISPGHCLTPMTAGSTKATRDMWRSNTPMGRLGNPADLQGALVYLASDASAYVTGHDLVVDGGYVLW